MISPSESRLLKEIFAKHINGTLLIDVLEKEIFCYEDKCQLLAELFNVPSDALAGSQVVYVVAKLVTAIHHANTLTMSNVEIMKLSRNSKYKKELAEEVMEQVKIAPYNLQGLENTNIFLNEPYIAPPIIYANILVRAIAENTPVKELKKNKIVMNIIYEGCKSVISIMVLFQLGAYSQAITVYRNLLDEMVKLQILELYPETLKPYEKFCDYNIAYQRETPSKEFLDEMKEKKIRKAYLQNYLMYGWLDAIESYNHNYSFKSATDLFSDGPNIYKLYEYASRFTHSTHIGLEYNWENLKYYFALHTLSIFRFLADTYHKYAGYGFDELNGLNLYDLMVKNGDRLHAIITYLNAAQSQKRINYYR